jgi:hypothetical protein
VDFSIEAEIGFVLLLAMALDTMLLEQRTDFAIEIDGGSNDRSDAKDGKDWDAEVHRRAWFFLRPRSSRA